MLDYTVKKLIEIDDYQENSKMAIDQIDKITQNRISSGNNFIDREFCELYN